MERKSFPIDFRHLETFCRVAELRSFSRAAEDLFRSQPTISGHILSLEESLSLRLFDRRGREAHLTKAGEVFFRFASKILAVRKDLMNALSEFSQGIRGELLLGASTLPGEYLLPQWMGDFNKEHPRFNLSLKIADTQKIVQEVLEGNVEFGVIGAKVKHPSLHYEKIEEDEIIVVGPVDHPSLRKKGIDLERLAREPWIIREEGSGTRIAVENALRKKGRSLKEFNVKVELGSTSSVKEGVKARLGFAFLSRKSVEEELNQGVLSRVDVERMDPIVRQIYLVTHRRKTLSPLGMAFLRFLKRKGKGEKS